MSESLVVTFAEIEFMLRAREPERLRVRELLALRGTGDTEYAVAAGLASLLARGLCSRTAERVTPSEEVSVVIAALSTATRSTRAMGWIDDQVVLSHYFTGPVVGIAVQALELGQFRVQVLRPERTVVDQLGAVLDRCLAGERESAVLIQSTTGGDAEPVSVAVATDASGSWFLSDSVDDPTSSQPSTRDETLARLAELLDVGQTVAAAP